MSNKDSVDITHQAIDMLLEATLKKHGVKLDFKKIDNKEKEKLDLLVSTLKKNVESLNKAAEESEEQ